MKISDLKQKLEDLDLLDRDFYPNCDYCCFLENDKNGKKFSVDFITSLKDKNDSIGINIETGNRVFLQFNVIDIKLCSDGSIRVTLNRSPELSQTLSLWNKSKLKAYMNYNNEDDELFDEYKNDNREYLLIIKKITITDVDLTK